MKQKIIFTFLAVMMSLSSVFFVPSYSPAYAQSAPCTGDNCAQKGLEDIGSVFPARTTRTVPEIVRLVINWALYLAAIVAVIFIIIGGFMYITSAGDPGRATKGRTTLVNALIGLAIIILSYMIVQVVYNFLVNRT